jgi:hypothetical protein
MTQRKAHAMHPDAEGFLQLLWEIHAMQPDATECIRSDTKSDHWGLMHGYYAETVEHKPNQTDLCGYN